jgi:type II secretory pathway pseudopilin PulG
MEEGVRTVEHRGAEVGFTLVEALVAMVVLSFGLMAVTNLLVVAASSNTVANQGTAAATSAARVMDMLKATHFSLLLTKAGSGTDFSASDGKGKDCNDPTLQFDDASAHCTETLPGVGTIHTHWWIQGTGLNPVLFIRVRSEGVGALTGRRSRSDFTTLRACSDQDTVGACPILN